MTVPQFAGKHDAAEVAHPSDGVAADPDQPAVVLLCYQTSLFDAVVAERAVEDSSPEWSLYDCYRLVDRPEVAVVGDFGIGAPTAAIVMEHLAARGTEAFLSVGYAGALTRDVAMTDVVVPDAAIRDDGTSHHYLAPAGTVAPTPALHRETVAAARDSTRPVHEGPTWTTDAAYRETLPEVRHYAAEGVLTVEMEAAATFAVARHRGLEAAAAFVVSDYVAPDDHEPRFEETQPHLEALFEVAVDAATGYAVTR
ncbi:MAG: nucleoside phosphorylase [Halolamina sp.]